MAIAMEWIKKNILYLAWVQALAATLGSLYYSEIMHLVPCVLCWYQRILMYPLVLILGVGILTKDKKIYNYVLPLSILGFFIALYHVLLQFGIISQSAAPCIQGISCSTVLIEYFGFVTIPFLSMTTFAIITAAMWIFRLEQKK